MEVPRPVEESSPGHGHAVPQTILVVDHDPDQRAATEEVLRRRGYRVKDATTFQEAKRLLALEPPDLLIADVRLGAFNGLHLLVTSRPNRPMAAIITCVAADPVLEAEAKRYGAAVYLVKPISSSVLLSTVSEALAGTASKPSATLEAPGDNSGEPSSSGSR